MLFHPDYPALVTGVGVVGMMLVYVWQVRRACARWRERAYGSPIPITWGGPTPPRCGYLKAQLHAALIKSGEDGGYTIVRDLDLDAVIAELRRRGVEIRLSATKAPQGAQA